MRERAYFMHKKEVFGRSEGEGTFLSKTGKVIFLEMYERKLKETLVLKGKRYTYRNLMQLEVQNFKNEILNGEKNKPYKYY